MQKTQINEFLFVFFTKLKRMDVQNTDKQLLKALKNKCNKNISFIDEVASVLDINYDAAYRRVNCKIKISLDDAIKLSKHFNVSLIELYNYDEQDKFIISKTKEINTAEDLKNYFNRLSKNLSLLKDHKNSSVLYCAKDLPIYYTLKNNLLSKFKLYVWLYILNNNSENKYISFEKFTIPSSLLIASQNAGKAYNNIKITEIWNYGIINSIVNQISYFYETKLLNYTNAMRICDDLMETINKIEKEVHLGQRSDSSRTTFNLYHNELLLLNNNVLLKTKDQKTLISPYSLLRYYLIEDQKTCDKFETFMNEQIGFSKLISETSIKETMLFFKPKKDRIIKLKDRIELIRQFPLK